MSKQIHMVAFVLLIIGGLNWLLVGLFNLNLVMRIFGEGTLSMIIYILVGLSAVFEAVMHKKQCRYCGEKGSMPTQM